MIGHSRHLFQGDSLLFLSGTGVEKFVNKPESWYICSPCLYTLATINLHITIRQLVITTTIFGLQSSHIYFRSILYCNWCLIKNFYPDWGQICQNVFLWLFYTLLVVNSIIIYQHLRIQYTYSLSTSATYWLLPLLNILSPWFLYRGIYMYIHSTQFAEPGEGKEWACQIVKKGKSQKIYVKRGKKR